MSTKLDFIIVGQGIAGTMLAHELIKRKAKVLVINKTRSSSSSMVAAGLYNPITGRKMVKTWNADRVFPLIRPAYKELEDFLKIRLLHEIGIYRPFNNIEELNDWQGKVSSEAFRSYVQTVRSIPTTTPGIDDPFGGIWLKQAGYLDVAQLITSYRSYLEHKGLYWEHLFNVCRLELVHGGVQYEGYESSRMVFCQGVSEKNPLFDWLPFRPVKGELMDVSSSTDFPFVLNRGVFMIPIGSGEFRLGATYSRDLTGSFRPEAEVELLEKLKLIYKNGVEIKSRKVGIRPATADRRPFIGVHPKHPEVAVFNGFGSKGVSLTPYYARALVAHLLDGGSLDEQVNVDRHYSLSSVA